MINTLAKRTSEIGKNEKENARISRRAAQEGIVLLKNDGVLPVAQGVKLALYGEGAANTIKGGIGSGEVNSRHIISIWKGLEKAGYQITTTKWLEDYQDLFKTQKEEFKRDMRKRSGIMNFGALKYVLEHPFSNPEGMPITREYLGKDTECCVYVITRQSGENVDRMPVKGGFLLTDTEVQNIRICTEKYRNTIIVINVGGYMDLSPLEELPIGGIIFFCQQGSEGGHALADIISGAVTPSAHLSSSWPMKYEDVPFGEDYSTLNGNTKYEEYREGIYVGYRYYDSFGVKPRYEFGYGLSYTTFAKSYDVQVTGKEVSVKTTVTNTGVYSGKEVVQLYASAPAGKLDKEYQRLVGFAKTQLLKPKESGQVEITFSMEDLSSYDEEANQFILEQGTYILRAGESSRLTQVIAAVELSAKVVLSKHEAICPKQKPFEELHSAKQHSEMGLSVPVLQINPIAFKTREHRYLAVERSSGTEAEQLQGKLKTEELAYICAGAGLDVGLPQPHGWYIPKTKHDYAREFEENYRDDLKNMVEKDYNHPSVIIYSVGNEISETARERGIRLSKEMVEYVHSLDASRPVTCGINLFLNGLISKGIGIYSEDGEGMADQAASGENEKMAKLSGSAFYNYLMEHLSSIKNVVSLAGFADKATKDAFSYYDICGYNYGSARYKKDGKKYSDRIIAGSETYIPELYDNWRKVEKYPYLIGDFVWVSWDYLGEAGLGTWRYGQGGYTKPYPMIAAGSGTIDLTGHLSPQAYYSRVAYGIATELRMAVRPVNHSGEKCMKSPWRITDAVESWSWNGCEGREAQVEVYSDDAQIVLFLNGKKVGKDRPKKGICRFRVPFQPGILMAKSYDSSGHCTGTCKLCSAAGKPQLRAVLEGINRETEPRLTADGQSLAYIDIAVTDQSGNIFVLDDTEISVSVEGTGCLQGIGSAAVSTEESYIGNTCTTYWGRAQAVVRAGYEPGKIRVTISAQGYEDVVVLCEAAR